jgi:peptide/nickel transport system substrate-binding protein
MSTRNITRRTFLRFSTLAAAGAVSAACAQTAPAPTAAPVKAAPTPAPPVATALPPTVAPAVPTATPVKKAVPAAAQGQLPVPRDETFVIVNAGPFVVFDSFNPYIPNGADSSDSANIVLYEPLWYYDPAATDPKKMFVSGIGDTWTYDNNYQKLTLRIRKGVAWNDGKPFTSADIAFTIRMLMENEKLVGSQSWRDQVDKVETPDDLTVVLTLKRPLPRFHYTFIAIESFSFQTVAKHIWEGKDPTTFKNWPPVTTGPYRVKQAYPDLKMFVYERRDDYWGKDAGYFPRPKYIAALQGQSGAQLLLDLQQGAVDVTGLLDLPVFEPAMKTDPMLGYTDIRGTLSPHGFHLNCAVPPLDKPEARWALAYLVNYQKYGEVISRPKAGWGNGPFNSSAAHAKYRNKDILAKYKQEYNPQKAVELLDKLGYKSGADGLRVGPDGKPIFLEGYSYYGTGHQKTEFLNDLAAECKKVGIDMAVRLAQQPAAEQAVFAGKYNVYVRLPSGSNAGMDPYNMYNWLRKTPTPLGERTGWNWNRWDNPTFNDLLLKVAAITPDDPAAMPLYDGLLEEFMKDMPSIPLVETVFSRFWSKRFWGNFPTNENYYAEPCYWCLRWNLITPKLVPGPGF